jgi:hypothetical protein
MGKKLAYENKHDVFEKIMIGGLTIFAAASIVEIAGFENLIGPSLFALCCLSVALPFLIFQIACITLGIKQQHRILLQTSTVILTLVGIFGLIISISPLIGTLFVISCVCAYYLFVVFSKDLKECS